MAEFVFIKSSVGLLPLDADGKEWFEKLKHGTQIVANVNVPRNAKFHRKFFAMLKVAYDNHEWPDIETPHGTAKTSKEMFRAYVIVKAGFYEIDVTPDGNLRPRPMSIKFGSMDEAKFEKLYSGVVDIILMNFLTNWGKDDMEKAVHEFLTGFA